MAITKISQYKSSPTNETDYQAQNEHLQAFINQLNSGAFILSQASTTSVPYLQQGVYIQMGGTVYIVDTSNYTIQGTITSGSTNYIYLTVSGNSLIATWITNISSYSWNSVYNHMSDGTNILLPYSVYYDGTYYLMGGLNKVFNQNLNTFNDVTFKGLNMQGAFMPTSNPTSGSQTVSSGATWIPPRGVYVILNLSEYVHLSINGGANYERQSVSSIFADGSNVRFRNIGEPTRTINYLKF